MRGTSKTTGRREVLYVGENGELMAVKVKYIKIIFRVRRHLNGHHSVWYCSRGLGRFDPHGQPLRAA
jgi:hypothetical protein